jgi:two-component system, chemotaxis family, chemotaxis protein CheY
MTERAERRILIIDDASLVRRYYRDALERAGFVVEEAFNGIEALEKVDACDLVIVDVNMPQMDGFTFIRTLRGRPGQVSSLPTLVTSTEAGPQDMQAGRSAGANFYLVKPVSQAVLVEHVAIMCGLPHE